MYVICTNTLLFSFSELKYCTAKLFNNFKHGICNIFPYLFRFLQSFLLFLNIKKNTINSSNPKNVWFLYNTHFVTHCHRDIIFHIGRYVNVIFDITQIYYTLSTTTIFKTIVPFLLYNIKILI